MADREPLDILKSEYQHEKDTWYQAKKIALGRKKI